MNPFSTQNIPTASGTVVNLSPDTSVNGRVTFYLSDSEDYLIVGNQILPGDYSSKAVLVGEFTRVLPATNVCNPTCPVYFTSQLSMPRTWADGTPIYTGSNGSGNYLVVWGIVQPDFFDGDSYPYDNADFETPLFIDSSLSGNITGGGGLPAPPLGGGSSGDPVPGTPSITQTSATAVAVSWPAVYLDPETIYYDIVGNPVARTTRSVESYVVQYWPTLNASSAMTQTISGSVTSINVSGLSTGTSYSFRVQATYRVIQYHMWYGDWQERFNTLFVSNPSGISTIMLGHFPIKPSNPSPPSTGVNSKSVATPVTLTWTSGDVDGNLSGYKFYFGTDSHRVETGTGTYIKTVSQPTITVPSSGLSIQSLAGCTTYYWRVTAVDDTALETKGDVWQFTTPCPPTVTISADETFGHYPVTSHFTGQGVADSGFNPLTIQSYYWEFRTASGQLDPGVDPCPGSTSILQNPCHTFGDLNGDGVPDPGNYTATLTVTDSLGQTATTSIPIQATLNVGPEFLIRGGATAQSMPAASYDPVLNDFHSSGYLVVWAEGDTYVDSDIWGAFVRTTGSGENTIGEVLQGPFPIDQSPGIQKDPTVIYSAGKYFVFWVDGSRGIQGATGKQFDISGALISLPAQFSYDNLTIVQPLTIDLAQTSAEEEISLQRPRVALWGASNPYYDMLYVTWEKRTCSRISFPTTCTTSNAPNYSMTMPPDTSAYFLVTSESAFDEGSYGRNSAGAERPVAATSPCRAMQTIGACPP